MTCLVIVAGSRHEADWLANDLNIPPADQVNLSACDPRSIAQVQGLWGGQYRITSSAYGQRWAGEIVVYLRQHGFVEVK